MSRVPSVGADQTRAADVPYDFTTPPSDCPDCGWPDGSFACKIRHQHLNTGWAKAAND